MPTLPNPHHEAFAQARFAGKSLVEAHEAAGFSGAKASASRLNHLPEVRERIAELHREAAAMSACEKTSIVQDLLAIIHSAPADVSEDHPLCEVRMGRDGPYHRLPPKLQALARLIKLMGWDQPVKIEVEQRDTLRDLLAKIRSKPFKVEFRPPEPSAGEDADPGADDALDEDDDASGEFDVEQRIAEVRADLYGPQATPGPWQGNGQNSLTPRQEKFAQARVQGMGVMAAYRAAGYTGGTANLAWRLSSMPAVKARIAALNGGVECAAGYHRDDAIRDLITIIRARPSEAGEDHPFCETRLTSWGNYHRFPSKLAAISLLSRMRGWHKPTQVQIEHDPDASLRGFYERIQMQPE